MTMRGSLAQGRRALQARAFFDAAKQALSRGDDRSRVAWLRHPLRILTTAAAALCLTWPLTGALGVAASIVGVAIGVLLGEVLGRSQLKASAALAATVLGLALSAGLAWTLTRFELVAAALGPAVALKLAVLLRFGAFAMFPVAGLRMAAVRRPSFVVVELVAMVSSIAYLFASHRGGVVARPLWLGDWAWRAGFDPVVVLLVIGASSFVLLAAILATEHGRRASAISVVALPGLAVLVISLFNIKDLPKPKNESELDLPNTSHGEPPRNPLEGPRVDAGEASPKPERGDDGGVGPSEAEDAGQDGGQGQREGEDAGQDGGQGQREDAGPDGGQRQDGQDGGQRQDQNQTDGGQRQDQQPDGGQQQDQQPDGGQRQDQQPDGGQQQDQQPDGGQRQDQQPDGGQQQDQQPDGGQQQQDQQPDGGQQQQREPPPPQEQDLETPPPPQNQQQNPAPMAIVLLGDDYSPPSQMFYLRQETWSQFAESRLVAPTRPDVDRDVPSEYPTSSLAVPDAPPQKGRKRIRAKVVMVVPHKKPFALETPVLMAPAANPDPKRFVRAYNFEALAQTASYAELITKKVGNPGWSKDLLEYYTRPPKDPRFAKLANEIVAKLDEKKRALPFLQAVAIKRWMDDNLTYSTRHRHANVPDPAADFLFGDRIGYCVHFAHVAVFMWRSLGIPARVGMGYAVNGEARDGSALLVRSGDGHAWPELYVEGVGWIVLDIAPKKNLDPPAKPVDKELQRKLGEIARQQPEEPLKEDKPGRLKAKSKTRIPWRPILAGLAAAIVLALYAIKLWRRVAPKFARARSVPRVGYRAALDMLSEMGMARETGETRESFARRVEEKLPSFGKLTEMHILDYFGDPSRPLADRAECSKSAWKSGLKDLRKELRPLAARWRAWLGRLNPASFFASK
jgi:transglutaminase-like putative cysteine protease